MERGIQADGDGSGSPSPEVRDRLVDAATRAATEHGYRVLDADLIARYAGLSVDDFNHHFADPDQCLLAGYDRFVERLREHIDATRDDDLNWPEQVKISVEAAFEFVSDLDGVARMFAVEAVCIGPAALDRQCALVDRIAVWLKQGRLLYPRAAKLPDVTERTLAAGVVMLVSLRLLSEEEPASADLQSEAVEMLLAPYIGLDRARIAASA